MTGLNIPSKLADKFADLRDDVNELVRLTREAILDENLDDDQALAFAVLICSAAPKRAATVAAVLMVQAATR